MPRGLGADDLVPEKVFKGREMRLVREDGCIEKSPGARASRLAIQAKELKLQFDIEPYPDPDDEYSTLVFVIGRNDSKCPGKFDLAGSTEANPGGDISRTVTCSLRSTFVLRCPANLPTTPTGG